MENPLALGNQEAGIFTNDCIAMAGTDPPGGPANEW
jgi:hypothetical protein